MNGTNEIRVYAPGLQVDSFSGTYDGVPDSNRPEEFDDIVKWVTLDELRAKMGCSIQIRIINNELPYGFENNTYRATVFAEGGVPFPSSGKYRWCRQGNLPSGLSANPSTSATDCLSLSETSWGQADNVTISGTPAIGTSGSYSLTFFVRDNNDPSGSNDNIAQKTLVLTINPSPISTITTTTTTSTTTTTTTTTTLTPCSSCGYVDRTWCEMNCDVCLPRTCGNNNNCAICRILPRP
jgi:hypothetical protein